MSKDRAEYNTKHGKLVNQTAAMESGKENRIISSYNRKKDEASINFLRASEWSEIPNIKYQTIGKRIFDFPAIDSETQPTKYLRCGGCQPFGLEVTSTHEPQELSQTSSEIDEREPSWVEDQKKLLRPPTSSKTTPSTDSRTGILNEVPQRSTEELPAALLEYFKTFRQEKRDARFEDRENTKLIMKHEKKLREKDKDHEVKIARKDAAISRKNTIIAKKDSIIAKLNAVLAEKDATIAEKDEFIRAWKLHSSELLEALEAEKDGKEDNELRSFEQKQHLLAGSLPNAGSSQSEST